MRTVLLLSIFSLGACGPKPSVMTPAADDRAWVVGTWTTSTNSWADAAKSGDATRFAKDGVLEHGQWAGGKFVAAPSPGPSGPSFVARYALDPKAHTISFDLDGAEEQASYLVEGPDRWKTISSGAEHVTVFYARRE